MTTPRAAVYNPHGKPLEELPVIYGFNNGGEPGWFQGVLLAQRQPVVLLTLDDFRAALKAETSR